VAPTGEIVAICTELGTDPSGDNFNDVASAITYFSNVTFGVGTTVLSAPSGTVDAPSITFTGDTDIGFYRAAANTLGFATAGSAVFTATNSLMDITSVQVGVPSGTAAAPGVTFADDLDTGIYRAGANQLGLATGGSAQAAISTTLLTSSVPVLASGVVATPAYGFQDDPDTGIYSPSAARLNVGCAGSAVAGFTTGLCYLPASAAASATTGPASGDLANGQVRFTVDEANNTFEITLKYSDGTYKRHAAALT
jgi:hypothetical protein